MDTKAATQEATALKLYGALSTIEEFKTLMKAEYSHGIALLEEEFNERALRVKSDLKRKEFEFTFFSEIIEANTAKANGSINIAKIALIEKRIANITFLAAFESISLKEWIKYYGESKIIPVVCDILSYFLNQITVKEAITGQQLVQLVVRLCAAYPHVKIVELIFVFNKVLIGEYEHYQRIGIDTILGWISRYYEESSTYMEALHINNRQGESRGEAPWIAVERNLQRYREEQERKKEISQSIWKKERDFQNERESIEARQREVENYRSKVLKNADSEKNSPK